MEFNRFEPLCFPANYSCVEQSRVAGIMIYSPKKKKKRQIYIKKSETVGFNNTTHTIHNHKVEPFFANNILLE